MSMSASNAQVFNRNVFSQLRRLELSVRRKIDSDLLGKYRTSFRGSGLVVSDLREYQPGDEVKYIDWKATARAGRVLIKSFEEEREARIVVLLDVSRSLGTTFIGMRPSSSSLIGTEVNHFSLATQFTGLIAMLALISGDAFGLVLAGDTVEKFIPAKRSGFHIRKALAEIFMERELSSRTDLRPALTLMRKRLCRRSIIIVVSDMFCPPCFDELRDLTHRHEVMLALVDDSTSAEIPRVGLVEFEDAESGRKILVDSSSSAVRSAFVQERLRRRQRIQDFVHEARLGYTIIEEDAFVALSTLTTHVSR